MTDNRIKKLLKPVLQLGKECICPRVEQQEGDWNVLLRQSARQG